MAFGLSSLFGLDVGIDLGTVNTLIARRDEGVILREPSAVAVSAKKEIIAAGTQAYHMLGRSPGMVRVVHPLQDGVIADVALCEEMLRIFLEQAVGKAARRAGVRTVLCVPGCVTDVEKRALEEAAKGAGARAAFLMDEPVAAAIGAGLPVEEAMGSLVVDIGGGTTDAAVLSLGGVVQKHSVRAGGTHIDGAILQYMKREHGMNIGAPTAEQVKMRLAQAMPGGQGMMEVRGRDMNTGLPRTQIVTAEEIHQAIRPQLFAILGCVREVLTATPPELAGDIFERGLCLTGGGALLCGMPEFFTKETGVPARVAPYPLDCVAIGARIAVENLSYYRSRAV